MQVSVNLIIFIQLTSSDSPLPISLKIGLMLMHYKFIHDLVHELLTYMNVLLCLLNCYINVCIFYIVRYVLLCTVYRNPLSFALYKCIYYYYYYEKELIDIHKVLLLKYPAVICFILTDKVKVKVFPCLMAAGAVIVRDPLFPGLGI